MKYKKETVKQNQGDATAKPNGQAQAPPAQENNETSPALAGGCVPRPCSALSAQQQLRRNALRQSTMLRKNADSIDKRMSDLPTDMPDYLYRSILWN